jgi:uncharacterized protein (TIGR00369 family)
MSSAADYEGLFNGPGRWKVVTMREGKAEASWSPTPDMANPIGNVHGGVVATIIDELTGAAVISMIEAESAPTVSMHVDFLRPIPIGATYTGVGEVIRLGRATAVADARIVDAAGEVLARGTCVFQVPRSR